MKSTSKYSIFDPLSSQRSVALSSVKQTASPVKFERRCKVSTNNSVEKLNKVEILHEERKKMLEKCHNTIEAINEDIFETPSQDKNNRRGRDERNTSKVSRKSTPGINNVRAKSAAQHCQRMQSAKRELDSDKKESKVDLWVKTVQSRKEELFKKRQEVLQAKLQVKEAKRQMLSQYKVGYTPKRGKESPIKVYSENAEAS